MMRDAAKRQLEQVLAVRKAVERNPERFILRPRYGPFAVTQRTLDGQPR
jgi:hypothetical protein